ncbi:MAG: phosphonate C-P lyase system protein PhnH [Hyphomicrobium sp.]|nr:phosphonate C-P lyase system protein PhnH [Hyphomicrobium sp.]
MSVEAIERGFADPVHDAQKVFRAALDAMAHPGRIARLASSLTPPSPLLGTSASLLLALADYETSIWLDDTLSENPAVSDFLRFHTGARLTRQRREADFAVIAAPAEMPALATFAEGTPEYPDRSTTLIVQVEALANHGWHFSGPGIRERMAFSAAPAPADFPQQLAANRAHFPRGVDLIFVTSVEIAALPRSTRIVESA